MAYKIKTLGLELPPHIWIGVSAENQKFYDSRLPALSSIDAPVRWVSAEPLLGPIDFDFGGGGKSVGWVVVGGETGPNQGRHEMDLAWARDIRDQCIQYDVPFFFKQVSHQKPGMGGDALGRLWDEYPEEIMLHA